MVDFESKMMKVRVEKSKWIDRAALDEETESAYVLLSDADRTGRKGRGREGREEDVRRVYIRGCRWRSA